MKKLVIALVILASASVAQAAVKPYSRSYAAKLAFAKANVCPSTGKKALPCPGYVIDHKKALACGGLDAPSNMQYQTISQAKAKDKWERKGCIVRGSAPTTVPK